MSFTRISLRGVLRDITKVLVGTVVGILLARTFLQIDTPAGSCEPLNLRKRLLPTTAREDSRRLQGCCNNSAQGNRIHSDSVHSRQSSLPDSPASSIVQVPVEVGERPKTLQQELGSSVRKPLFIGVVTAQKLLQTRARAINETWGKSAPKLAFFSSSGRSTRRLPVISLPGVDDTYPPQRKVFKMLKYMHDNFIDKYNWFMRADDDVYVRVDKLTEFLSQLDPSKELYLGQPGMGKPQDLERIKLRAYEHYCMGGPGVIYSQALLRKLAPHLDDCLENEVVSINEDLEVGRCISRRVGIQCTWNYQVSCKSPSVQCEL